MSLAARKLFLLSGMIFLSILSLFSQHTSKNDYSGEWDTPSSWTPSWSEPQTSISGYNIVINGYITVSSSLIFSGTSGNLIVNDTLVVYGDLYLNNNNDVTINDNAILIVRGDLSINNETIINSNGYLIITGDLIKVGSNHHGSFKSNDNPEKLFIGGSTITLGYHEPNYPALNCPAVTKIPYGNSHCSYGNMTDFLVDPLYAFFLSTCTVTTPLVTPEGPTTFCEGGSVTLTSSEATGYSWSNGAATQSITVSVAGSYYVQVRDLCGSLSQPSAATMVTVNDMPEADPGPDQELKFSNKTVMDAVLAPAETCEWSIISGSGHIEDINSPITAITSLATGENKFLFRAIKGDCEANAIVRIIVVDPMIPSVITPDGDGKNDYFVIGDFPGKVDIIIINRWGNLEYSNSNYQNDWDGRNNKGIEVPNDTYFYILNFGNSMIKKGSILVKR